MALTLAAHGARREVHSWPPVAVNRLARGTRRASGPVGPVTVRDFVPLR